MSSIAPSTVQISFLLGFVSKMNYIADYNTKYGSFEALSGIRDNMKECDKAKTTRMAKISNSNEIKQQYTKSSAFV